MKHTVFVGDREVSADAALLKLRFDLSRIGIQHEDLFEMGLVARSSSSRSALGLEWVNS